MECQGPAERAVGEETRGKALRDSEEMSKSRNEELLDVFSEEEGEEVLGPASNSVMDGIKYGSRG